MISAALLTHNDETKLEQCLKLLTFCDEIVIIDDMSTDNTVKVANKFPVRVVRSPLQSDFAAQRNRLLEQASNEWVLFVDSDEQVTTELRNEIKQVLQQPKYEVYYVKRVDYFWGKPILYGEVTSAHKKGFIRLVKKGSGKWKGKVHEEFVSKKEAGQLANPLHHFSHQTISEFIADVNMYSSIRAEELRKQGRNTNVFELFAYPFGKFVYTYFVKMGFKDGAGGFVYSFMMSFHSFLVRAKLYVNHHAKA